VRPGASLVELLVALTVTAVVLAVATGSLLRQQRTSSALHATGAANAQLRAGTSLLPAQLALLSPATSDLAVGQIRDTALQFRSAIATGVSCDSGAAVVFAIEQDSLWTSGVASTPHGSDSLWWYDGDSARWNGRLVVGARTDSARCGSGGTAPVGQRRVMHVDLAGSDVVPGLAARLSGME
jgi:type II secretory pathway pseudopilin PulG